MDGQVSIAIESKEKVPGCYTRAGWDQYVKRELATITGKVNRDSWVTTSDARRHRGGQ